MTWLWPAPRLCICPDLRRVRRCSQAEFLVVYRDMERDPIIQQVRAVRKEIEQQYPDAASFYQHLEQVQKAYRERLVRRHPKKAPRAQAS